MISFRFYVVATAAVFLGLAIGVVVGSTTVDRVVVENLRDQVDRVERNLDERQAANEELDAEVGDLSEAVDGLAPFVVAGRLTEDGVVVVSDRGVDEEVVDAELALLRQAGADAPGVLWLEPEWVLDTAEQREQLAAALGIPVQARVPLLTEAWSRLLDELGGGESTATLDALADAGFVTAETDDDQALAPSSLTGVELVTGTDSDLVGSDHHPRMARMAAEQGLATVLGEVFREEEDGPQRGELLAPVRDDEELAGLVGTVDDLDLPVGRVAAVLTLAIGPEVVGHYGYGEGAQAVVPEGATG